MSDNPARAPDLFNGQGDLFDPFEALKDRIEQGAKVVRKGGFGTLTEVMERVVKPMLTEALPAWDNADLHGPAAARCFPATVLRNSVGEPQVVIAIGPPPRRGDQTHPFHKTGSAIQLAVSAEGRTWSFHHPAGAGEAPDREFERFDIVSDPVAKIAESIEPYFGRSEVGSGQTLRNARKAYRRKRFPVEAPKAWRQVVEEEALLARFQEVLAAAIGVPVDEEAASFVRRRLDAMPLPPASREPRSEHRVTLHDRVWVCNCDSDEIRKHVVVDSATLRRRDMNEEEVSRDSPVGKALLGAREGEWKEVGLPRGKTAIRILLVRPPQPSGNASATSSPG